jgi:hypothetical protein
MTIRYDPKACVKFTRQEVDRLRRGKRAAPRDAYHHGAARGLERGGGVGARRTRLEGFSLREGRAPFRRLAGRAGHHFGDADGLLRAVATSPSPADAGARGRQRARRGLTPVRSLRDAAPSAMSASLRAYTPSRFGLMFRTGLKKDEALERSAHAAFMALEQAVRDLFGVPADAPLAEVSKAPCSRSGRSVTRLRAPGARRPAGARGACSGRARRCCADVLAPMLEAACMQQRMARARPFARARCRGRPALRPQPP